MANEEVKALAVRLALENASFNQGMRNLRQDLSLIDTQFSASVAGVKDWGKTLDGMRANATALGEKIKVQSEIVKKYADEIKKTESALSENSKKMMDAKNKVEELAATYEKAKSELGANADKTKELKEAIGDAEKELKKKEATVRKNNNSIKYMTTEMNKAQAGLNKLEAELKDVNKELENHGWEKFGQGLESVSKKLQTFGRNATRYITTPIAAAFGASIKYAMDLEESINKVEVAFGSAAQSVLKWSETTIEQYGIARGTALDMAATYGDMATSMGLPTYQAAEMSKAIVGLAGDLSAFKNISVDRANTALTAIFTGETESLKKLGIVMTEANLQQYAYTRGIQKKVSEMTQAEKLMLRYNYVFSMTANAQGDFVRTSGDAAQQTRQLKENIKSTAEEFGENMLPIYNQIITKVNELVKAFNSLDEGTQNNIINIGLLLAVMGPVATVLGKVTSALKVLAVNFTAIKAGIVSATTAMKGFTVALLSSPIGLIATAIAALGVTMFVAWNKTRQEIKKAIDESVEGIRRVNQARKDALEEEIEEHNKALYEKQIAEEQAHAKKIEIINKEYQAELDAGQKKLAALRKELNERAKLEDDRHNAAIEAIRREYGVFERAEKSKTELVQDEYELKMDLIEELHDLSVSLASAEGDEYSKTYDAILEKANQVHNEKIAMYQQEYLMAIGLINSDLEETVRAYRAEIDALKQMTEEENRIEKENQNREKIDQLRQRMAQAKTREDYLSAEKALNDEVNRQNREKLREQRDEQIKDLNAKIETAKQKAREEKDALLPILQEKIAGEQAEIKKDTDFRIGQIQRERIAKEEAENAKYLAAKEALDKEAEYLDNWIDTVFKPAIENKYNHEMQEEEDRHRKRMANLGKERDFIEESKELDRQSKIEELNHIKTQIATIQRNMKVNRENDRMWGALEKMGALFLLPEYAAMDEWKKRLKLIEDELYKLGFSEREVFELMTTEVELPRRSYGGGGGRSWGPDSYEVGAKDFKGGFAHISERGGEIVNLPRGANIIPHDVSMEMARALGRSTGGGINITVVNRGTLVGSNGMNEFAQIISRKIAGNYAYR